jgi:hypothetical protein
MGGPADRWAALQADGRPAAGTKFPNDVKGINQAAGREEGTRLKKKNFNCETIGNVSWTPFGQN